MALPTLQHHLRSFTALTVEHTDADGLLLLDGLCVWEASVADVVAPGVLRLDVGEVEVSVQSLRHTPALRQTLEICADTDRHECDHCTNITVGLILAGIFDLVLVFILRRKCLIVTF